MKAPTAQQKERTRKSLADMREEEWESIVLMFLPQLLADQGFLFNVLMDRVRYRAQRFTTEDPLELLRQVLGNLGLQFTTAEPRP